MINHSSNFEHASFISENPSDSLYMSEWHRKIRAPTPYRVGGTSVQLNPKIMSYIGIGSLVFLAALMLMLPERNKPLLHDNRYQILAEYNNTYPLSTPIIQDSNTIYRIAIIADLDTDSKFKEKPLWFSYIKYGQLTISKDLKKVSIKWDDGEVRLESKLSSGDRGMELSELVAFNGRLYSCDDRTGIIYEITRSNKAVPWVVLQDGNGKVVKGFKCEWLTVKNRVLYAGGLGKEWTTTNGVVLNEDPQWVKSIGYRGDVQHHNWVKNYRAMQHKGGFQSPGYLIHESAVWSDVHQQWFMAPRRASVHKYDEHEDERRAANLLFRSDENFSRIKMSTLGPNIPTHGFSSLKFIPGTQDRLLIALKSEEDGGKIATYATVIDIDGVVVMAETRVGSVKYEGVEFV